MKTRRYSTLIDKTMFLKGLDQVNPKKIITDNKLSLSF